MLESNIRNVVWNDELTGNQYQVGCIWNEKVINHLSTLMYSRLMSASPPDSKHLADSAARFWAEDYYRLVFPIRFGYRRIVNEQGDDGLLESDWELRIKPLFSGSNINLEDYCKNTLRSRFLDEASLPPILPAHRNNELVADHVLIVSALASLLLKKEVESHLLDEESLHQIRLAILTHHFTRDEGPLALFLKERFPLLEDVWRTLSGEEVKPVTEKLPSEVVELITELHDGTGKAMEKQVGLIAGGIQRVKRYVFESAGLNEIRGASVILDEATEEWREIVTQELGPETVLRAAGSVIEFLAPADSDTSLAEWVSCLRRHYYLKTGTAFLCAGSLSVTVKELLERFPETTMKVHDVLQIDRNMAVEPLARTMPFEQRCSLCGVRPAELISASFAVEPKAVCEVCNTKRSMGQKARRNQINEILKESGLKDVDFGVRPDGETADSLEELLPEAGRRSLIAMIYGDGNNFGKVVQNISSIAENLQWTNRVEKTSRAAALLALAQSSKASIKGMGRDDGKGNIKLDYFPFQIIALGGDDISLITWGRMGLDFSRDFVALTDMEFEPADRGIPRISFSIGVLITGFKVPVRLGLTFAEKDLMKWAKKAIQKEHIPGGSINFLVSDSADGIPGDAPGYFRKHLVRKGYTDLCLTLRPVSAKELSLLLDRGKQIVKHQKGAFRSMVEAYLRATPMGSSLYYNYQKSRGRQSQLFEILEKGDWAEMFGAVPFPAAYLKRPLLGIEDSGELKYVPIWDLFDIIKSLE